MAPYWSTHTFRDAPRLRELLTRYLGRSPARRAWWFSPLVCDVLRVAPYFAFHYGFEQLVREDADAARVWEATPVQSADPPHVPFRAGLLEPLTPRVRAEIDGGETPVYKLTRKLPQRPVPPDSILAYLFAPAPS